MSNSSTPSSPEAISVNDSVSEEGYVVVLGKSDYSFHNPEPMDLANPALPSSSERYEVISSNNSTGSANSSSSAPDEFIVNFDVAPEECPATCRWVSDLLEEADSSSMESNMKQGSSHSVGLSELEAECHLDALQGNWFGSNTGSRSYFSVGSSVLEFNAVNSIPTMWRHIHFGSRLFTHELTDRDIWNLSQIAQGNLQWLELVDCVGITDACF